MIQTKDQKEAIAEDLEARNKMVKLKATDAHPNLPEGTEFEIHVAHESKVRTCGWGVDVGEKNTKAPKSAKKAAGELPSTEANTSA